MAYTNGFPATYQQMYTPQQYQQQMPQQMFTPQPVISPQQQQTFTQQPVQQQQYPTVQGGFVRVRNENEARMYPVAPASSVTFIDENGPYVYTKTANMGQLDRPIFEKYRLIKEDEVAAPESPVQQPEQPRVDLSGYALKTDVAAFKGELEAIRADVEAFRGDLYGIAGKKKAKKEATPDE